MLVRTSVTGGPHKLWESDGHETSWDISLDKAKKIKRIHVLDSCKRTWPLSQSDVDEVLKTANDFPEWHYHEKTGGERS